MEKMKKFVVENWFKLIISLGFIALVISVSYSLNFQTPTESSEQDEYFSKDLTRVIGSLYPDIIEDYLSTNEGIIVQDFGQPRSVGEAVGFIDDNFSSENHIFYSYGLVGGSITFFIDKETRNVGYIEVNLAKDSDVKINVPGLGDKGDGIEIVLGESTFGDVFDKNKEGDTLKKVLSYQGGSAGNSYTNLDFYFGKYGNYHEFTFGVPGLYDERINTDHTVLRDIKPTKLRIR